MTLIERLQKFFGIDKSSNDSFETYDELEAKSPTHVSRESAKPMSSPTPPATTLESSFESKNNWSESSMNHVLPLWLEDETMLRDEGVVFGLSASNAEEKTAIIRNYFTHQSADLEREVERWGEKIQELNLFIEQKENRIGELKQKNTDWENKQAENEHNLPRTLVGLGFSATMCIGNYYLIEDTLRPLYPNSPWIAVGVFLAGMFNLFGNVSLFYDPKMTASWRKILEEIGMPLAAAIFVFVQAFQTQTPLRATALLIFVFFLFMFAGKLLLSNITLLRQDLHIWLKTNKLDSERKTNTESYDAEIAQLTTEIDQLRVQKWQIMPDLNRAEAELTRLYARRDALIKLFESEFNLARNIRNRLTEKQLKNIKQMNIE